jgi:ribosomal protein S18
VWDYTKSIASFFTEMRQSSAERKKQTPEQKAEMQRKAADSPLAQHERSVELLKRMKWRSVTWTAGADYDGFSNRVMNSPVLERMPPFSYLSLHLLPDATAAPMSAAAEQHAKRTTSTIALKQGDLSSWLVKELDTSPKSDAPVPAFKPQRELRPPYEIDWETGEVFMLDSASATEVLSFLQTAAPALQALQSRDANNDTKLIADVDKTRLRLGVVAIKFNDFDRAFWSDPARKAKPADYVDPAALRAFITSAQRHRVLLRRNLKDHQLRLLPPGEPYRIDREKREVCIPCNFEDYNRLAIHDFMTPLNAVRNFFTRTVYIWFLLGMMVVGDLEII